MCVCVFVCIYIYIYICMRKRKIDPTIVSKYNIRENKIF